MERWSLFHDSLGSYWVRRWQGHVRLTAPRVVFLVVWWLDDFGGMERHVTGLALALQRNGWAVRVFSENPVPAGNQYRRRLSEAGIPLWAPMVPKSFVTRARKWTTRGVAGLLHAWLQRFLEHPAARKNPPERGGGILAAALRGSLARAIGEQRPSAVHVHGFRLGHPWLVPWLRARGIPVVYTEHSTIGDWGGPFEPHAPDCVGQANAVACVSGRSRDSLAELMPGRPIAVHGHFVPQLAAAGREDRGGAMRIATAARLSPEKGIDVLLRAAAMLRGAHEQFELRIAGEGSERAALAALVRELDLDGHVTFTGSLAPGEINGLLEWADIFVLPSRTEALPVAIVEAMASGLPIVATRVGGIPEFLAGGGGILVEPESAAALASALGQLAREPELRASLQRRAVEAFRESIHRDENSLAAVLESYRAAATG